MSNLLVDERDQRFVAHEMLNIGELCETPLYGHLSRDVMDASMDAAVRLAIKESYPIMAEADREECRLENGTVRVPQCFHRFMEHFAKGGWPSVHILRENGGQGFPMSLWAPLYECFMHNAAFIWIWATPFSATSLIEQFGSGDQRRKYLKNLASGKWGSALAAHEDLSGSDLGMQQTVAVRQADGSFRIRGAKSPVTSGDSDLFENTIQLVCARTEGDPANESGISLFVVPKYLVNEDGTLGRRNDFVTVSVERKLGIKANPTCQINYGENGDCYAEILGEERQGMAMIFQVLKISEAVEGTLATGVASTAYLHALDHAKKRIQGAHISQADNLDAERVAIIAHPDVRRMLLWMKSQVEGLRALLYYSCLCLDKSKALPEQAERERWSGLADLLLPIFRVHSAEVGLDVARETIKVHGRYGVFSDYPVQQFLRDITQPTIGGITVGISALLFAAQTLGQRDGKDFANLLHEMNNTVSRYKDVAGVEDLAAAVRSRIDLLGELALYFADCAKNGNALVPISNATPFAHLMGHVCVGWLLLWQCGIAAGELDLMARKNGLDPRDGTAMSEFLGGNKDAAYYSGKVHSARYYIKNVLPRVDGLAAGIRSGDLSIMTIHDDGF